MKTQSDHANRSSFVDHLQFLPIYFIKLHSKSKGKGTVHYEDRRHEQKHIKPCQIIFPYALRRPGTMVIVTLYAYIAVCAVETTRWDVELTFSAKSIN